MPLYQFQARDGSVLERFYLADRAPALGVWVRHRGKRYRRIISSGITFADARARFDRLYPYLTSQHAHLKGARRVWDPRSRRMKPLIESAAHERRVMLENGLVRD